MIQHKTARMEAFDPVRLGLFIDVIKSQATLLGGFGGCQVDNVTARDQIINESVCVSLFQVFGDLTANNEIPRCCGKHLGKLQVKSSERQSLFLHELL